MQICRLCAITPRKILKIPVITNNYSKLINTGVNSLSSAKHTLAGAGKYNRMIILAKEDILATLPFDKGESCAEWLETNGLGGWSGSTICGCNTRRYHGLLVAATRPPTERMALVSKLDETVMVNGECFQLGTNNYGSVVSPQGYKYLSAFTKGIFPAWVFEAGGVQLQKTVAMLYGQNTVVILYQALKAVQPCTLQLLPLLAVRGYHSLVQANDAINKQAAFESGIFSVQAYDNTPRIYINVPGASFRPQPCWYYHFNYTAEQARRLDYKEDLFSHGQFDVEMKEGSTLGIIISTEDVAGKDACALFAAERARREAVIRNAGASPLEQTLAPAAEQFIVSRGDGLKTVIAGYHWFTDWARDTMISLPGLCLCTGRHADAKKILAAFTKSVSMGMLPNRFTDNGGEPEYNNVDGTLWFFIAVYKYMRATGDEAFILGDVLPALKKIIDWHFKGTRYNIHVDDDGLLYAGEQGQQLTWMDARVGDWVVTPRMGKPVEVQALWYNALRIYAELLKLNRQPNDAAMVTLSAEETKKSFAEKFWFEEGGYLYDVIDENGQPDTSLRPNQLFAISLPFALVDGERAEAVVNIVREKLLTPVGLRSLGPGDSRYIGIYSGGQQQRDGAYHQGTVWAWLLGPYVDALAKTNGHSDEIKNIVNTLAGQLQQACLGSVPEIFDGDAPHRPKGCVAQAWSVAEWLRVVKEQG